MNNEAMYNAFVKDRPQQDESDAIQDPPRVSEEDIPVFEIEVEEPGEDIVVTESEFSQNPAPVANGNLGDIEIDVDIARDAGSAGADVSYEQQFGSNDAGGFDDYMAQPEAPVSAEEAFISQEDPPAYEDEFQDFRREPEGYRNVPQNDLLDDEGVLTFPPYQFEGGGAALPPPEIFNSYPPEVQRKIMEWADRDLKARRDDESRRQDAVLRANIARDRTKTGIPLCIIVLCILCGAITGVMTHNVLFPFAFLAVAIVFIIVLFLARRDASAQKKSQQTYAKK